MSRLRVLGERWKLAREREREAAEACKAEIREVYAEGATETQIAEEAQVDRMTVRRALGKL